MSILVQKLIDDNKVTREPFLDLGNCDLTEVPLELRDLPWLRSLSFATDWDEWNGKDWEHRRSTNQGDRNWLEDLAPLAGLTNLRTLILNNNTRVADLDVLASLVSLQSLYLSGTRVSDLTPLADLGSLRSLDVSQTRIWSVVPLAERFSLQSLRMSQAPLTDLAPLANLASLRHLDVSATDVRDLAPLSSLASLTSVSVSGTLVSDLAPLINLASLAWLCVSNTDVSDLGPLTNLPALRSLDISGTQVSNVAHLANLRALRSLNISRTQVRDLAPLAKLRSLRSLYVSGIHVKDLSPIASLRSLLELDAGDTQVSNLSPLVKLSSLHSLHVPGTPLTDLSPLTKLGALQSLDVSRTDICDLTPLRNIASLQWLDAAGTQIRSLDPLAKLTSLKWLRVSHTRIWDLSPLAELGSLNTLDISSTRVESLAPILGFLQKDRQVKCSSNSQESVGIYVEFCPLTNPPMQIATQGNEAIINYFVERANGKVDHLYEAKMLVLGEGGAGKTSLIRRLFQPGEDLPAEKDTTRGIEIHRHQFKLRNGSTFRLNVWDFGGQQIYHATHQLFLTHRSLYVLLDDTRKDHKSVSDEGFRYWLELIEVFGGHSPTLIFQNEKDGRSKAIDLPGITRRYDNVKELYCGNLENTGAADKLRNAIEFFAANLNHVGDELPASWIDVRAEIERLAADRPYVPVEEYFKIYGKYVKFDETKALHLSHYLHDLGVFLHFQDDPLLRRTVFLQNEWATTAVFRVLDDEIVKKKLGRFDQEDCARLWKGTGYDQMHLELLALMQNFELCYALRDCDPPTWLVPQLLPPTRPAGLANRSGTGDLILRYKYDFLPKGMISRLTVRQHRFVHDPGMAWVTGVLFERDKTVVLVEVRPSGDEIELRARGPEDKALLSVISADLDALNDSFEGLRNKVDVRIPCTCGACRSDTSPHFYGIKELLIRKELKKRTIECKRPNFEEVEVLQLLDGIELEHRPEWAKDASKSEPRVLSIFLASSSELREDRDAFELYLRQQNDRLRAQGMYLQVIRWENFLDAISDTRLQSDYNEKVRQSDIFVSLFFKKAGKYTEEEFDAAYGHFKSSDRPLIYTYFKDADVRMSELELEDFITRQNFIAKLRDLGHYETEYTSVDGLNLHFSGQLPMIREKLFKEA